MEIVSQHAAECEALLKRLEPDSKSEIETQVKHLQLQLINPVNYIADRVCVQSHLRGDYEMQRVVEL